MKKIILLALYTFFFSPLLHSQSFLWAEKEGDTSEGQSIATDAAGNSYVSGKIYGTTNVGGQTLDPANGDYFLAKYDNSGNAIWVKQIDSMEIFDIACSSSSVYLSGRYQTNASFNGTAIAGGSGWDAFILRLDTSGNITMQMTGTNTLTYESANSIATDNSGNMFVTGVYRGATMTLGTQTLTGNYGLESMFLMKIDPSGNITWIKTVTSNDGGASGNMIKVAPTGDIYVVSSAQGDSLYYGSIYYNPGAYDAEILLHYDNTGTALRMDVINQTYQDVVTDMAVDASGNIYTLQTNYLTSYTLVKYNSVLDTAWQVTDGTGGHLSSKNVLAMQSGEVVVSGDVGDDATFNGSYVVHDYGGQNGYLAFYNSAGTFSSLTEIPGNVFMAGNDLDASDNIYLAGDLTDSASFGSIDLSTTGASAMYLAKYGSAATGVEAYSTNAVMNVFPNPCNNILNCELTETPGSAIVQLFNVLGEKVYEKKISDPMLFQIDLSDKNRGIYFLKLKKEDLLLTKKIIVN